VDNREDLRSQAIHTLMKHCLAKKMERVNKALQLFPLMNSGTLERKQNQIKKMMLLLFPRTNWLESKSPLKSPLKSNPNNKKNF